MVILEKRHETNFQKTPKFKNLNKQTRLRPQVSWPLYTWLSQLAELMPGMCTTLASTPSTA